jgi:hypothetical protein
MDEAPLPRTPRRKGHVRPSSTPGRHVPAGVACHHEESPAKTPAPQPPARTPGNPHRPSVLPPPTVNPQKFAGPPIEAAADPSSVVRTWTPQQCKAVLLAACDAGFLGPAFLDHFEAVAVEEAIDGGAATRCVADPLVPAAATAPRVV